MTTSELYSTGIYFTRPDRLTPGRLYIDVGSPTTGAAQIIMPDRETIFYEGFTELTVTGFTPYQDPGTGINAMRSISVTLVGRYFKESQRARWMYCPFASIGQCPNIPLYSDIEVNFNVAFRNNTMIANCSDIPTGCPADSLGLAPAAPGYPNTPAGQYRERLHGGLYFYKMAVPPIRW